MPELDVLLARDSPTRTMLGDACILYAAFPSFVYPVLSAKGGKGVDDHDRIGKVSVRDQVRLEDVVGRAKDTIDMVLGVVFLDAEREDIAASIRELHRFIHGQLDDGVNYHAWETELWNWTWVAIVLPLMEVYGQLRGWPSDSFREEAYAGMRAVGVLFGADTLPATYQELIDYRDNKWMESVDPGAAEATAYLLSQRSRPSGFRAFPKISRPLVRVVGWPVRHIAWIGLLLANTDPLSRAMGLHTRRIDRLALGLHHAVWRTIPRHWSGGWIERYVELRSRYGKVAWRTHYSPEALAGYRAEMKRARAGQTAEPPRPSAR
ncbi:oxygenase MpaB family protein [Gordonia araii]|nr:oxygenase MpaB family protein [Gordonia araii]NNG98999.1 DUF2236 domain-containing protein [Gordonia araii NBRC 100433]